MKHLVVFSGAGMSAESGLKTFRDNGGLWENHRVEEVATPEAWEQNKELVLRFYNMRRTQLFKSEPNNAHKILAQLENKYHISVITQNIDDLHERAGSKNVIHLHGELKKAQSEKFPELVYDWEKEEIEIGDLCERGFQLRPNVVWFGEAVPKMIVAEEVANTADILIVIGTSLNVYPAAGLIHSVPSNCKKFLIDPKADEMHLDTNWTLIASGAEHGMQILYDQLAKDKD